MNNINWGIIGCGNVTELKSGPAFNKVEHSKLVAVMRRNFDLAKDYAFRHNVPKAYSDANELINDTEVNAVYIATPPDSHTKYAIDAMRAGKAVYVEKPMARTYDECLEMIRVSEETNQPLYVAYYRRTLPLFLKVKELIDSNEIGKPLLVNIRLLKAFGEADKNPETQHWHVNPSIAGAGHFYDLASHQFDYLDFLFGKITKVNGFATNTMGYYSAEDSVSANYLFESGVMGTGCWSFIVDKDCQEDTIEIIGTAGKIIFSCFDKNVLQLIKVDKTIKFDFDNHENISYSLIKQVVGALRGENECLSTMYTAARTNYVMEKIVDSYYKSV